MTVAVILKGYPRLSETFVAQELLGLERRGVALRIFALRRPTDGHVHAINRAIRAPVAYLPEYVWQEPLRVWRAWRRVRRRPGYRVARAIWLRHLRRDPTPNRGRRFAQALVLADELPQDVRHLYVHFLHTPGSVGWYASRLTGLPWSVSAHAKDIWTLPDWEKAEKLAACEWLVTCTASGAEHLSAIAAAQGDADKVTLLYHGLDLGRFPPPPQRPPRDGRDPADPVTIVSVGRPVPKKGYAQLLDALARLPAALHWRFLHVGAGPLTRSLQRQAERLGIAGRIEWMGAQPQDEVIRRYAQADLFVLASRIDDAGDRDGLPNVLMEAQAMGLACVSTRVSAIPELIEDGRTGRLVEADDIAALAAAIAALIADPAERRRLGEAGRERVRRAFSFEGNVERLARRFGVEARAAAAAVDAG